MTYISSAPVPLGAGLRPGTTDANDTLYGAVASGSVNVGYLTAQ